MLFSASLAIASTLLSLAISSSAAALPTDGTSPALSTLNFDKRQVAVCNVSTCPRSTVPRSIAACVDNECSFVCKNGNKPFNGGCVPNALCTTSNCPTPAFAKFASCPNDVCSFVCFAGYRPEGGACVLKAATCGPNTCVGVTNGVTSCSAGACFYTCRSGFTYAAVSGTPTCLDLNFDVANCGAIGNTCDNDYTGAGTPYCKGGACNLNCPAGQTPTLSSPPFCSA